MSCCPQIRSLLKRADQAATAGLNTLLIEWEGTFPIRVHPIIPNRFAYTDEEITAFLRHCEKLGLDVIPLQQCFGHVEYILRHPRYLALRENPKDLCQLGPCKSELAVPRIFVSATSRDPRTARMSVSEGLPGGRMSRGESAGWRDGG